MRQDQLAAEFLFLFDRCFKVINQLYQLFPFPLPPPLPSSPFLAFSSAFSLFLSSRARPTLSRPTLSHLREHHSFDNLFRLRQHVSGIFHVSLFFWRGLVWRGGRTLCPQASAYNAAKKLHVVIC
jgi:hypothetical protein